jgi:uncharacterized protein (DUF885 family)
MSHQGLFADFLPFQHDYPGNFTTVCEMQVDLSQVPQIAKPASAGGKYYTIDYDVILIFGLTELQAQVRWFEGVSI